MKSWFLGSPLAFISCLAFAQSRPAATTPEADVLNVNKALYQALVQEDVTAMQKMLGAEYVLINSDGKLVDRETLIGAFRDGYLTPRERRNEKRGGQALRGRGAGERLLEIQANGAGSQRGGPGLLHVGIHQTGR